MQPSDRDLSYLWDMRNILAHEYGEVKMDKVYLAATISIPALLESLEPLLPE